MKVLSCFWGFRDVEGICFPSTITYLIIIVMPILQLKKVNYGEIFWFVQDHAGIKQLIQDLNPDIFFFHYDIFPLLTLNPSQVLIPLKLTSQTTDIILSQSNYQIKNNLMSWFSASIGMLLNWWYSWCSWLQRTLLLILAPTGDLFSSQSMGFLLLLLLLLF